MKPEQLEELLCYRMEQANETLREAEILLKESALRGTINRAYYAMFYALRRRQLAAAAEALLPDYAACGELTIFTALDSDDFYASG
jgi:hypothetical protein